MVLFFLFNKKTTIFFGGATQSYHTIFTKLSQSGKWLRRLVVGVGERASGVFGGVDLSAGVVGLAGLMLCCLWASAGSCWWVKWTACMWGCPRCLPARVCRRIVLGVPSAARLSRWAGLRPPPPCVCRRCFCLLNPSPPFVGIGKAGGSILSPCYTPKTNGSNSAIKHSWQVGNVALRGKCGREAGRWREKEQKLGRLRFHFCHLGRRRGLLGWGKEAILVIKS